MKRFDYQVRQFMIYYVWMIAFILIIRFFHHLPTLYWGLFRSTAVFWTAAVVCFLIDRRWKVSE